MKNLKLQIINERRAWQAISKEDTESKQSKELKLEENGLFKNYVNPENDLTSQKILCIKCGLDTEG